MRTRTENPTRSCPKCGNTKNQSNAGFNRSGTQRCFCSGFINSMAFTHEEAKEETPVSACNITLSVAPTIRIISSLGVANFVNFAKGEQLKKFIQVDAFSFVLDAF